MSETNAGVAKRKRVPSVLVDCKECSATFEVDARTFDLSVELGYGQFLCDECKQDTETDQ